jgi:glycerophosphoryl diester phosphodiesterase
MDVQLARDGRVLVIHDHSTKRMTGSDLIVAEHESEELRALTIRGNAGFQERFPLLEEVLDFLPDGKRAFVEIKSGPETIPPLKIVLENRQASAASVVIIGFDLETMRNAKRELPKFEVCWVVQAKRGLRRSPAIDELIAQCQEAGLDGLDLEWRFPINARVVSRMHELNLKLYTWTVDNLEVAKRLKASGVDGITSNLPGLIREGRGVLR